MSTLVVSNISDGTTTVGASYVTNGSAKAWVNFDGTGTIAARDSLNVSSLTDDALGSYTTNISSSMANSNYAISGSAGSSGSASGCWHTTGFNVGAYNTNNTTSSFKQQIYFTTTQVADIQFIYSIIQGDLA